MELTDADLGRIILSFTKPHITLDLLRAVIAADRVSRIGEYPALPESLEIEWPRLHSEGLGCGVEDRSIYNRYEAAEYGFNEAVEHAAMCVPEHIFDADQMRAYAAQAIEADRELQDARHAEELAAQPEPAQTARKPMTTVQMEKGRTQIFSVENPFCPCDSKTFMKVARYVESFHGIKE